MVLKIPTILDDYYDEIEQDLSTTSHAQILDDCDYIIGELDIGEWYDYPRAEKTALKRFRTRLKNNMSTVIITR